MQSGIMSNFQELKKNEFWRKKYHKCMQVYDANNNGKLSRKDIDVVVQRYRELGISEKHLQKTIAILEQLYVALGIVDETVQKTYEEAIEINIAFLESAENVSNQQMLWGTMFDLVDTDEDNHISHDEWQNYYKALGLNPDFARASFDAMDTNKDGKISRDEYCAYHKEYFFTAEDNMKSSILFGPLE